MNHPPLPVDHSKPKFTYPKEEHLKSRKAIEQLFKSGQSFFIYPYKVVYQINSPEVGKSERPKEEQANNQTTSSSTLSTSRLADLPTFGLLSGFAVSTKNFKRAVDRNRIKRLGREAFRLNKPTLIQLLELGHQQLQVFFIFTDKKLPDYKLIEPKMQACLKKLGWLARQVP